MLNYMQRYLRFFFITLVFFISLIYVLNPWHSSTQSNDMVSWSYQSKMSWLRSCVDGNIGTLDLCECVLSKLQLKFDNPDEMYNNPQRMIEAMRESSAACKN